MVDDIVLEVLDNKLIKKQKWQIVILLNKQRLKGSEIINDDTIQGIQQNI